MRHDLSEWSKDKVSMDIDAMNALVAKMFESRDAYETKKAASDAAYHEFEEAEQLVIKALLATGLRKYSAPGLNTISVTTEMVPDVPKTLEDKRAFHEFIGRIYGVDYLESVLGINANTIKSKYKEMITDMLERGVENPKVPGIPEVKEYHKLNRGKKA